MYVILCRPNLVEIATATTASDIGICETGNMFISVIICFMFCNKVLLIIIFNNCTHLFLINFYKTVVLRDKCSRCTVYT